MEEQHISFRVNGKWVTEKARELVTKGNFAKAMNLVLECTESDELTEREHEHLAYDILNGNADIIGIYPDEDYGIEDYDETKTGTLIGETFSKLKKDLEDKNKAYETLLEKYNYMVEYLQTNNSWTLQTISKMFERDYGYKMLPCDKESSVALTSMLQEYLDYVKSDENEYGWLEPNGTFHPVEWGEHDCWAYKWLEKHYPMEEYPDMYWHELPNQGRKPISNGDVLTYKLGWICIDSPMQGKGRPRLLGKPMTKGQKEFLYQYYMDRDRKQEANALYTETS